MRLCVTGFYQGEYMYMLGKEGFIMNYKEYGVNKQCHAIKNSHKTLRKNTKNNYFWKRTFGVSSLR